MVDYIGMIPVLTQAIQEQQEMINNLTLVIQKQQKQLQAINNKQQNEF
jgi:hypothetical protein